MVKKLFYRHILIVSLLAGIRLHASDLDAGKFWAYMGYFDNKTGVEYIVHKYCEPKTEPAQRTWVEILRLLPFSKLDKLQKDSLGQLDILIKDPMMGGCLIKIAPVDPTSKALTYYIKPGLRTSGSCVYNWLLGPYEIIVSAIEPGVAPTEEEQQKFTDVKVRYCGYQDAILGIILHPEHIEVDSKHRSYVIDQGKYSLDKIPLAGTKEAAHE